MTRRIVIVGGGAAGFFAAIKAAELYKAKHQSAEVYILEASDNFLKKVRISGGGRCNVTHHIFDVRRFCENYPRGSKELLSAMQRFQARDTVAWFAERGVEIVPEEDGRMFPSTNNSQTIIDCFLHSARELGVRTLTQHSVQSIVKVEGAAGNESEAFRFQVNIRGAEPLLAHSVMIATGSSQIGYGLARELGHTITPLAPSLFSFKIDDALLRDLPGLSFSSAEVKLHVGEAVFKESGPLLITHWGLSGPGVLKISAWAAREMAAANYQADLVVNWLGLKNIEAAMALLKGLRDAHAKSHVGGVVPDRAMAKRFWLQFLREHGVPEDKRWADVSNKELNALGEGLYSTRFKVLGKNRYKDEFVECGGVDLKEINFKTMESKLCPGLYFAGEVLDVDGITGGFNFQNAWTGGWIAGQNM